MNERRAAALSLALSVVTLWSQPGRASVMFQNTGNRAGWTSVGIQHQGKVDEVTTPTYKGRTALRMEQTFEGLSGYHSEVRLHEAQGPVGSDVYYGMALYLPPNWIYHGQNVTFQQWARGDVFGSPWVLMFVENDEIRTGGSGGVRGLVAKITGMQGQWIRVVTHIRHSPTNGLFEVWVNGTKTFTQTGDISPANTVIRWSAGMYCTRWRAEEPRGLNPMILFQDHYRVATTYEEADPASWDDGGGGAPVDGGATPPSEPDAGVGRDAPAVAPEPVAGPGGSATPTPPAAPPVRPPSARPTQEPTLPLPPPGNTAGSAGCGCRVGRQADVGVGGGVLACVLLGLVPLARRRRSRRSAAISARAPRRAGARSVLPAR
jgi:hypothetical protein